MCIIITKTKLGKEVERKGREGEREGGRKINGKKGEKLEEKRGQKKYKEKYTTNHIWQCIINNLHYNPPST